jgi:hypothetical protein
MSNRVARAVILTRYRRQIDDMIQQRTEPENIKTFILALRIPFDAREALLLHALDKTAADLDA